MKWASWKWRALTGYKGKYVSDIKNRKLWDDYNWKGLFKWDFLGVKVFSSGELLNTTLRFPWGRRKGKTRRNGKWQGSRKRKNDSWIKRSAWAAMPGIPQGLRGAESAITRVSDPRPRCPAAPDLFSKKPFCRYIPSQTADRKILILK